MSIVSSSYTVDLHSQADGRKYVEERHTDADGSVTVISYLAVGVVDYAAIAAVRAGEINNALVAAEAAQVLYG